MEVSPRATMQSAVRRMPSSDKPSPPSNTLQIILIEKYRLYFLQSCRNLKRPPQSLRISGSNALPDVQKLPLLSEWESKSLEVAIQNKLKEIHNLQDELTNSAGAFEPMKKKERKKWLQYFQNKIDFYKSQENTKWNDWPAKSDTDNGNSSHQKNNKLNKQKNKIVQKAQAILEAKQVRILTNETIPPEAIVVLGKGLGFVPTPKVDVEELRLDGRRLSNKIARLDTTITENPENNQEIHYTHNKSKPINYSAPSEKIKNPIITQSIDIINTKLNALNYKVEKVEKKHNLSHYERQGLKWLEQKTSNLEIVITPADKGGSILITDPSLIENKIEEKVNNVNLFKHINQDPRQDLYDELLVLWRTGKEGKFVTEKEACDVVGLTKNNNKSTSSYFKPGITYFTPSLKIHKMEETDIIPGSNPPARLISSLQEGVTKHSDVFIANKWLKQLEDDFCIDLVKDTNSTLRWLDNIEKTCPVDIKKGLKPFTFDFEALYDSLSPELVLQATKFAINKCRPHWSNNLSNWIISNVELSMKSAVCFHKGKWYKPVNGIPTGGSLSVQLANIAVYYVLHLTLYSNESLMCNIHSIKRFIDDEAGFFSGTIVQFESWKKELTRALNEYKLNVKDDDWDIAEEPGTSVHFLDIQFGFDMESHLNTDIYIKETDSRTFLDFNSCHPNHTFSSIVYSQALRYRRIINDDNLLKSRLDELKRYFRLSNYPNKLINNIIDKVASLPRVLDKNESTTPSCEKVINVISTYGRDDILCNISESVSTLLTENKLVSKFQYIKKTASSLKNKLCKSKHISLGGKYGCSISCNRPRCKNCKLMSGSSCIINSKGKKFKTAPGNCLSKNIIYAATCELCSKNYVGKSTQICSSRNNGHRAKFIKYKKQIEKNNPLSMKDLDDEFSLGIHLHNDHNIKDNDGFDKDFKFIILDNCRPKDIGVKGHLWIQKLRCLYPHRLNLVSPPGFPLLV